MGSYRHYGTAAFGAIEPKWVIDVTDWSIIAALALKGK
jgi:hypothetical protein